MKKPILFLVILTVLQLFSNYTIAQMKVVSFEIRKEIAPAATRLTRKAINTAINLNADLLVIDMNTYGGLVNDADSIRSAILNCEIPVWVFINKNAASAGALISIACDKIYMQPGSNIGAATVVDQSGSAAPDKYQSYMRSMMRSTAEFHGMDTIRDDVGNTIVKYKRNPKIAEAMVDPDVYIPEIIDSGKILTFTTTEAITNGFCNGEINSIHEMIKLYTGENNYELIKVQPSAIDTLIGFLQHPAVAGVLILVILGGIYFELQTPGIGFPSIAAAVAAILYFAPHYLDGLAENWEILIFIVGLVLIALEIFVIPGFGVAGISGIILTVSGLILSMVGNRGFDFELQYPSDWITSTLVVFAAAIVFLGFILFADSWYAKSAIINKMSLNKEIDGHIASPSASKLNNEALAFSELKPYGKILIDNKLENAMSIYGFINKNEKVKIIDFRSDYYIVEKI